MSTPKEWKKKYEELSCLLKEKEQVLENYKELIDQSNQTIKEVMEKLSQELNTAHQIHKILLPVDLPVVAGCEFSFKFCPALKTSLSKDFYEVFAYPSSKSFALIMSSCSSHALSALLFSARLKMMSQQGRGGKSLSPKEFISHLIQEIKQDLSEGFLGSNADPFLDKKICLFYAVISQKTWQMSYFLAGDITALLWHAEDGKVEVLKSGANSLLTPIKTKTLSLNGRDRFILCSPGVLKSRAPDGEEYGLSALLKLCERAGSVHELRNKILYALKSFAEGRPLERDQSILVMEVKSKILKLAKF